MTAPIESRTPHSASIAIARRARVGLVSVGLILASVAAGCGSGSSGAKSSGTSSPGATGPADTTAPKIDDSGSGGASSVHLTISGAVDAKIDKDHVDPVMDLDVGCHDAGDVEILCTAQAPDEKTQFFMGVESPKAGKTYPVTGGSSGPGDTGSTDTAAASVSVAKSGSSTDTDDFVTAASGGTIKVTSYSKTGQTAGGDPGHISEQVDLTLSDQNDQTVHVTGTIDLTIAYQ